MVVKDKPTRKTQIFSDDLRKLQSGEILQFNGGYSEVGIFRFIRNKRLYFIDEYCELRSRFLTDCGCEPYEHGWNAVNWVCLWRGKA